MINILLGKNNKFKEKYVNEFILSKQNDLSFKLFVVVPEQSNLERQIYLLNNDLNISKGLLNIEVSSFNHLAYKFFSQVGYDITKENKLDEIGKVILLRQICRSEKKKLKYYGDLFSKAGFIQKLKSAVSELYLYGVNADTFSKTIKDLKSNNKKIKPNELEKYNDIAYIYKIYTDKLKELGFFTPDDVIDKYYKMLTGSENYKNQYEFAKNYYKNIEILFDDFTGITPVQRKVIYALSKLSKEIYVCIDLPQKEEQAVDKIIALSENIKNGMQAEDVFDAKDSLLNITDLFYMSKKYVYDICAHSKQENIQINTPKYIEKTKSNSKNTNEEKEDINYFYENILPIKYKEYNNVPSTSNIKIYEAQTLENEINNIASEICKLIKKEGYRYKDICIITKNSEAYKNYIVKEFQKKNIPFFMDIGVNLIDSPYVECIRAGLEVVAKRFSTDSVLRFLNSRIFDSDFELDNYIRKIGISGIKKENKKKCFSGLNNKYVNALIALSESTSKKRDTSKKEDIENTKTTHKTTGEEISKSIYKLIDDLALDEKFDKQQKSLKKIDIYLYRAYEKSKSAVYNLLNMISTLLKDSEMTLAEFYEIFDSVLLSEETKILPVRNDQVLIGNLMHSRFVGKKILFFIGLDSESIPIVENNTSLISDNLKKILEDDGIYLSQNMLETAYNSYYYCYMHFKTVTDKIYLSYSKINASNETVVQNRIIEETKKMFSINIEKDIKKEIYTVEDLKDFIIRNRQDKNSKDEIQKAIDLCKSLNNNNNKTLKIADDKFLNIIETKFPNYNVATISENSINDIISKPLEVDVSSVENFAGCPYKYFLEKVLEISERQEFEISNIDYGNVCHNVLSELFKYIKKEKQINSEIVEISDSDVESKISELVDLQKEKCGHFGYTNKSDTMFENVKSVLMFSYIEMKKQIDKSSFVPIYMEEEFEKEKVIKGKDDLDTINYKLKGRIDRIDVANCNNEKFIKITDYKTGKIKEEIHKDTVAAGNDLQLLIYMGEAKDKIQKENPNIEVHTVAGIYNQIGLKVKDYVEDIEDNPVESKSKEQLKDGKLTTRGIYCTDKSDLFVNGNDSICDIDVPELVKYDIDSADSSNTKNKKKISQDDIDEGIKIARDAVDTKVKEILSGKIVCSFLDKELDNSQCGYCEYKSICRHKDFSEDNEDEIDG